MTTTLPYSPEELEALGREHYQTGFFFHREQRGYVCAKCREEWPCATARLLATVEAKDAEIAAAEVGRQAAVDSSNALFESRRDILRERDRFESDYESLREQLRQQVEMTRRVQDRLDKLSDLIPDEVFDPGTGNDCIEDAIQDLVETSQILDETQKQLRQQTERAEKAERGVCQLQEVMGPLQDAKSSLDDLIPYAESLKQEVAVLRAGRLTVAPISANDEGAQDAFAQLEAENAALKAQVEAITNGEAGMTQKEQAYADALHKVVSTAKLIRPLLAFEDFNTARDFVDAISEAERLLQHYGDRPKIKV